MPVTNDEFLRFLRTAAEPDPARLLDALLECSGAERGFLVFREGGELVVRTARAMNHEEVLRAREKVSRTLLERALAEGRPVVATDADIAATESLQEQKVRAVCALPLPACGGAVYLDHRGRKDLFADARFLHAVAGLLDTALRSALDLARLRGRPARAGLLGESKPMQELLRLLDRAAAAPYPVLVVGESGTGKELVARALHRLSPRAGGPFVAANCAAFPETLVDAELFGHAKGAFTGADRDRAGLFEQAHGGVLFLDEIACLSSGAQESCLRALETGEVRRVGGATQRVDVRVVAATNEDPELLAGFRKDLFYRLNVLRLDLPPLRDRREDIPLLAAHFLEEAARETNSPPRRLAKPALALLVDHRWPGNVRQLANAIRRAVALSERETLELTDFTFLLDRAPRTDAPGIVSLDDHIRNVLVQWDGKRDLQEIADLLGISRKTLWEKKKRLGL